MPNRTFLQARRDILDTLEHNGWQLSDRHLKVPHATSPNGEIRLWFKPQAVYVSHGTDFKYARTFAYDLDIRRISAEHFIGRVAHAYPQCGQTLPVAPAPGIAIPTWKEPTRAARPAPRPAFKSTALKPKYFPFGSPRYTASDEEIRRAVAAIPLLNERQLTTLFDEYQVAYDPRDRLSALREIAMSAMGDHLPATAIPQVHDPRQQSLPMPFGRRLRSSGPAPTIKLTGASWNHGQYGAQYVATFSYRGTIITIRSAHLDRNDPRVRDDRIIAGMRHELLNLISGRPHHLQAAGPNLYLLPGVI